VRATLRAAFSSARFSARGAKAVAQPAAKIDNKQAKTPKPRCMKLVYRVPIEIAISKLTSEV
jgi:hypothetical protein